MTVKRDAWGYPAEVIRDGFGNASSPYPEPSTECPYCVTPWKCNGPHLETHPANAKEIHGAPEEDVVNQPDHYKVGGIETIDYLKAKLTEDEFIGYLRGNVLKYLSRAGYKDDVVQDYKKAAVYLNWLIKYLESGDIK